MVASDGLPDGTSGKFIGGIGIFRETFRRSSGGTRVRNPEIPGELPKKFPENLLEKLAAEHLEEFLRCFLDNF